MKSRVRTRKTRYEPLVKLPPLPPDQYDALRQNIAVNGVLVPILVDSSGPRRRIIDGNHRKQIADELGYDCPEVVHEGDDEELRTLARALNLARRQLTTEQKRQVIADQLRETPKRTNRWVAKMLGVSHPTVADVRAEMESVGKIYQQGERVGNDGKTYKSEKRPPFYRLAPSPDPQNYQTPPCAVEPLLKHLPKKWVVWECACGLGSIVRFLGEHGRKVVATDIKTGQDFMKWKPRQHYDCVVTNPPHRHATAFLRRCYELGKPFALLLPLLVLEGKDRHRLFRQHGLQLLFLDRRIRYVPEDGEVERPDVPFLSAWFCWRLLKQDVVFEELQGG